MGSWGDRARQFLSKGEGSMVEDKVWGVWVWVEVPFGASMLVWVTVGLGKGVKEVWECDNW